MEERTRKEIELRDYFIGRILKEIPYVRLNGDAKRRLPNNINVSFQFIEGEDVYKRQVQAADAISAARPGARRETLETYTNRLKQLEDITNSFKGVDKSFAIQAGREIRVMVVPEHVTDSDMVLLARNISKQIEAELELSLIHI